MGCREDLTHGERRIEGSGSVTAGATSSECARPRAQQCWKALQRLWIRARQPVRCLLRPRTGALRQGHLPPSLAHHNRSFSDGSGCKGVVSRDSDLISSRLQSSVCESEGHTWGSQPRLCKLNNTR